MKVKRYTGETMQDAIFKVKAELGSEAVILNTRTIKTGGILGLFGKKLTEVMAAAPEQVREKTAPDGEILELKQMLTALMQRLPEGNGDTPFVEGYAPPLRPLVKSFFEQGLEIEVIRELMESLNKEWQDSPSLDSLEGLLNRAFTALFQSVRRKTPGRVQAFMGPTGVGKTTTIAKLAANYVLSENKRVALLTTDTYRIAAVEQLKIYSEIIDVPMEVLYKPPQLKPMIQSLDTFDYILLDTAGLSPTNRMGLSHLQAFLKTDSIDTTYLVLAACTRDQDLKETIKTFQGIGFQNLLFTKLDETDSWGSLINSIYHTNCWSTYITTGQDVPEDMEKLTIETLTKNLTKGLDLYGSSGETTRHRQ